MIVLVTGATSQIGHYLLPRLRSAGYDIVALSREVPAYEKCRNIRWITGHIESADAICFPSINVLIHLAPLSLLPALLPILIKCGCRRVICFGTTSRYSKANSLVTKEKAFAAAQIESEQLIAEICSNNSVHWTLFRPTLIYGCAMDRNVTVIARLIRRLNFFPLFGAGLGLRQPVHADDLASACVTVIESPTTFGKAYDLTGGETITYREMVARIFDALNAPRRFVTIPMIAFQIALWTVSRIPEFRDFNSEMARRMNEDLVFDSSDGQSDFGYTPRKFDPSPPAV